MATDTLDEVKLAAIDVGLGQSLLITTPGGHRWLVDGGAGSSSFDIGESVVAPYLTLGRPPRLDGVFMSHPDADHSHGLPFLLSRFDVGTFYTNGMMPRGRTGKRLRAVLAKRGMVSTTLQAGQVISLGEDLSVQILHPQIGFKSRHANERSLIMRLVRRGKALALLPGDVENDGIGALLNSGNELGLKFWFCHTMAVDPAMCLDFMRPFRRSRALFRWLPQSIWLSAYSCDQCSGRTNIHHIKAWVGGRSVGYG